MNRFRHLPIGAVLIVAWTVPAQLTAQSNVPVVEVQLKMFTEKLDLTSDQQTKIKSILQELHAATQKLSQDKSLSGEERMARVRPQRYKADKQIREILTDTQKKKLDQLEQEPHPEMHENVNSAAQPPRT